MRHTRIIVTHYGGPDALRVVEEECPEPKDGEVRVRVLAAGVSLPDIMAREGVHPETPPVPFTPGWDLVGVVDRLGTDVPSKSRTCRDRQEMVTTKTAPTWSAAIMVCRRCKPVRRSLDEPDLPRSSSIISIRESGHPYDRGTAVKLL
jgi:D-arabinose 1-dehydrogenase-like Zn-dependent alcohol dehydrogenase